jgi:FkbH-like protein
MSLETTSSLFPWRVAMSTDWPQRIATLDGLVRRLSENSTAAEYNAAALEARRLANQALGAQQNLKLQSLARRMLSHAERFTTLRCLRIGLTGNRTLSYLIAPLRAAGLARGLLIDAFDVPFDAVRALALGQSNVLQRTAIDAIVIILDEGAFRGTDGLLDDAGDAAAVDGARIFLERLVRAVRDDMGSRAIFSTIPAAGSNISSSELALGGAIARFSMHLNNLIVDGARRHEWLMWDLAALAGKVGTDRWVDPVRFHEAKVPFRIELGVLVADHLCRTLAAMSGKSCRALVLDLDDTLWGGSIGDDGISGIRLGENSPEGEAYLAFQRFILSLRQRGIVLAISSKNADAVAREPFREHPEMLLREEHIAVFQANWEDKATNLHAIAEALNLSLESLAFVDDNAAERERVRQQLPLVSVPEIGSDPAFYPGRIADSGVFDHLPLTAEDRGRAENYQSRAASLELKAKIGDYDEYLRSLKMTMSVSRFDRVDLARITQLINKSNQFNLTTRRYTEAEVRQFEENAQEFMCWQIRLDDAFGRHGIISVVIVHKLRHIWEIDTWLMSCRVLARGVEETLINLLMAEAREARIETIVGEYCPTQRNALVADFYPRLGFDSIEDDIAAGQRFRARPASHPRLKSFIDVKRL